MSYHVASPRRVSRRPRTAGRELDAYTSLLGNGVPQYPLVPLSQAPQSLAQPSDHRMRNLILVVVVVLLVAALLWWIDKQNEKVVKPNRSRAKKQSTAAMAKNLYKRLDDRGGVNDTTMRSLQQLGRNA